MADPMIADINFTCSHCGQKIAVGAEAAGQQADCPSCQNTLTIPAPQPRNGRNARTRATNRKREPAKDGFDIQPRNSGSRDRASETDPVALREQLAAAQSECERLRANATHAQAEIKSFQNERRTLRAEIANLKQHSASLEMQVADLELESGVQGQRLAATATQLETKEAELAEARAAAMTSATACNELEHKLAEVHSHLAVTLADLKESSDALAATQTALEGAEANAAELEKLRAALDADLIEAKQQLASASDEVKSLRRLVSESETGRELVAARAKLAVHETESQCWEKRVALLEADLQGVAAQRLRSVEEIDGLRLQLQDALQKAEAASDEKIHQDNAVLRGIVSRQNVELELQHHELKRLKRARFALRLVYALFALGLAGLAWFAVQFVPQLRSLF